MVENRTEHKSIKILNNSSNGVKKQKNNTAEEISEIFQEKDRNLSDKNDKTNHIPKPSSAVIDNKSISRWISEEEDEEFKKIKEKLIENIRHIEFLEFLENLDICIEKFNNEINGNYAIMWDYKPHSSKRWTYMLAENKLLKKPIYTNFFNPSAEKFAIQTIENLHKQKINKFVAIDDSAYSGEQVFNRFIIPIMDFFKLNHKNEKPEFYIVIPFITNSFKEKVAEFMKKNNCKINLIYSEIMPQIKYILNEEEFMLMNKERNGSIEINSEEPLYKGLTLTFFDHRVADDHSFSPEIAKIIKVKYQKPYAEGNSEYSKREQYEFRKYWKQYQDKL